MKVFDDILGFTFSEIAFLLLYMVLACYLMLGMDSNHSGISPKKEIKKQQIIDVLKSELIQVQKDIKIYKKRIKQANLKSKITPSCSEIGLKKGYLFTVTIVGKDKFNIGGNYYSLNRILGIYEADLNEAKKKDCIHRIIVKYSENLSAKTLDSALKKLERYFYILRLSSK